MLIHSRDYCLRLQRFRRNHIFEDILVFVKSEARIVDSELISADELGKGGFALIDRSYEKDGLGAAADHVPRVDGPT